MIFIIVIALITINGCGICVLMHKWDEHKEKQDKELVKFKEKIFEHVRGQIQEVHIENEVLLKKFKKFRDESLKFQHKRS